MRQGIGMCSLVASVVGANLIAACTESHEETPGEEACEHLVDGPVMKVDAGVESDDPGSASMAHVRYDITFPEGNSGLTGFLEVAIEDEGEYLFYFDEVVGLTVSNAVGVIEPEAQGDSDVDCDLAKKHYTFDLAVGTYLFELRPETTTPSMVFFGMEHTHNH